ncbi:crotonase/enoyl-CoA hydratase family protein [Uniformispora flossi]|uniref:crotonase/enoyl-CoA hydratase family protein n=1 Tax=Uniformispora flossi TaxID=3390723 RepID=UPI0017BD2226|nr:crotonase/enoyl-CoA hydratase family protein [Streptomycetaceae bacterium]
MAANPHLLVERRDGTLLVTLNRPEAKNAFSLPMLVGLYDAWLEADADDDIYSIVLTGAGGVFCAGMDLKALAGADMADGDTAVYRERMAADKDLHWKAMLRHHRPRKPLIAAVEGFCVAGGTEILQGTDIRVAGDTAVFAIAEVQRGLFPLGGSTVRLQRQIGYTNAMEMLLTGRRYTAEEAREIGLIGRVVPAGTAVEAALEIAAVINGNGPIAVEAVKRSIIETADLSEEDALKRELEIGQPVFGTADAKEGPTAFAQKRKPVFRRA